jgi:hypothetical protein
MQKRQHGFKLILIVKENPKPNCYMELAVANYRSGYRINKKAGKILPASSL